MPKFRILTPAGLSFSNSGGGYSFEMEALEGLDAEIFECAANDLDACADIVIRLLLRERIVES